MSKTETNTKAGSPDLDYARNWLFDEDGDEVQGRYVEAAEGPTQNGPCPIIVLNVDGEHRSVWAFHTALRNRIADEIARRPDGDLTPGELVVIRRGDTKDGANGRSYRSYSVRFPEAPARKPKDIFTKAPGDEPAGDGEPATAGKGGGDSDIPFRPTPV